MVQGMTLKITTVALPSTPFNTLNYLTTPTNIPDFLKGESAKGAVRLQSCNNWTVETAPDPGKVSSSLTDHLKRISQPTTYRSLGCSKTQPGSG